MPWTLLKDPANNPISTGNLAIHAALVPTQQGAAIFYFDGVFGAEGARLFDADALTVSQQLPVPGAHIFCSGHAFLGDGRLVVSGGTVNQDVPHGNVPEAGGHDSGERRCYIYNPLAGKWEQIADFNFQPDSQDDPRGGGRWYPTLITVGNGEVLAVAGHPYAGIVVGEDVQGNNLFDLTGSDDYVYPGDPSHRHNNNTPERYRPALKNWALLTTESSSNNNLGIDEYPRIHLAPSGHVFFSTIAKGQKRFYNPYTGTYAGDNISPGDQAYFHGSEPTSVLLPILPTDPENVWVLACGGTAPQRINLTAESPQWVSAGARDTWVDPGAGGNAQSPVRRHACAVILPTGDVFITGGVGDPNNQFPQGTSTRVPEIYKVPIDWKAGKYNGEEGDWTALTTEPATVVRGYHSVAILMPDGRVWTGGSTDIAGGDDVPEIDENGDPYFEQVNDFRIEIYEPDYYDVENRPIIESCPPSVGYAGQFRILVEKGPVQRVALTRCGSVTHAFDSDQRHVGLFINQVKEIFDSGSEPKYELTLTAPVGPGVAPPGNYLLWAFDPKGNPCQRAKFIRICDQYCSIYNNHSTFSILEAEALLEDGNATFDDALYIYYENFRPGEINYPNQEPSVTLRWDSPSGSPIPASLMKAEISHSLEEDASLPPDVAQRFTFVYKFVLKGLDIYDEVNVSRDVFVRVGINHHVCGAYLKLTTTPNPYMVDIEGGNHGWLSADLRAFQIRPGQTKYGVTFAENEAPLGFLIKILAQYNHPSVNNAANDASHPFRQLPVGFEANPLELSRKVGGEFVYNFAIAKVRYRANNINAENVKVFFRLFNTVGTWLDYNTLFPYRRAGSGLNSVPLLGRVGQAILSIPFFALPRVTPEQSMEKQPPDPPRDLLAKGAEESITYFGCWLDLNQTTPQIAPRPVTDGPYLGNLFDFDKPVSIQELMRNPHQCLLAEIFYEQDPIPDVAKGEPPGTPGNNDNLAQRNLVVVKSGNPGLPATRTVQTTFVVKPSSGKTEMLAPQWVAPKTNAIVHMNRVRGIGPDELLVWSRNLPKGSQVTLYMPDVDAGEILQLAARRLSPATIERVDEHTIRFSVHNVTFIPLPGDGTRGIPGLMSVELPEGVKKGQIFTLTVQQASATSRKITGSFQLTIPVDDEEVLLEEEKRKLSVLRHIFKAIPEEDIWHPIFVRFLGQIGDRVRGFGGDPEKVYPSPDGEGTPIPRPDVEEAIEGKVVRLLYDCFGDFEGFVLATCDNERTFRASDKGMEKIIRRACQDRSRITVYLDADERRRIVKIVVHCC